MHAILVQVVATRDDKQRGREEEEEEERRAAKSKLECTLAARVVMMTRTKGATVVNVERGDVDRCRLVSW
jgi:hypothetical protein